MGRVLGKIQKVSFGRGGYQGAMIGLNLQFTFPGGVCGNENPTCWDPATVRRSDNTKWTEAERGAELEKILRRLSETLHQAKVRHVADLEGIPVELTFEGESRAGATLESWRILEEVL